MSVLYMADEHGSLFIDTEQKRNISFKQLVAMTSFFENAFISHEGRLDICIKWIIFKSSLLNYEFEFYMVHR